MENILNAQKNKALKLIKVLTKVKQMVEQNEKNTKIYKCITDHIKYINDNIEMGYYFHDGYLNKKDFNQKKETLMEIYENLQET